ncbi:MAG TPA: hypothetical protein VFU81_05020, partial [Thermomicrobiales bacterium]|nr:hypothetical protein [Thermomicrobiales bacterium]
IVRSATPEERVHVADWLRSAIGRFAASDHDQSWAKRAALGFLALLGPDGGLADEELLAEYRAADLWDDAAFMLLQRGRVDEALGIAARHLGTTQLVAFANELLEMDATRWAAQAIDLVDGRLWEQEGKNQLEDQVLLAWLARAYAAHGQPTKALDLARRRFDRAPSKEAYDAVKTAALLPGQPDDVWERTRPTLQKALRKQGGPAAMIAIHLEEGEVPAAIEALEASQKKQKNTTYGFGGLWWNDGGGIEVRIAEAAETSDPDAAIRIYRRLADRQIDVRQRDHYRQAASYLARVKQIMTNAGRAEQWTADIAELRQSHKSLRALREELDALDLR